ncbi:toprim domain-containing protein [Neorhizobium sp. T786]|uniref:toprim domain-containing protein n=1 Tax=Pseudorhizobium xiangyangii TaxID=2883104 RepID=UPI001CFFA261|nr:toprim domain-containing protein [Neorhizobium xiangyangii]MCB5201689.1 toprim domain-containing protein [Neorhizobium xiangyangii]
MQAQGVEINNVVADFLDAMKSAGVNIDTASPKGPHPVPDGQLHRANALGKKSKRNMHVWYVLHADGLAAGAFGDYALGIEDTWCAKKPSTLTDEERRALKDRMKQAAADRAAAQAELHKAAASAAALILKSTGKADPSHAYLAKKGLPVFAGLRVLKTNVKYIIDPEEEPKVARAGNLVVPMFSPSGDIVGAQIIQPDGTKRFIKGTAKEGNYHSIGKPPEDGNGVIIIAEGYATGARMHEATGFLTIAAFDAGNLLPVARAIRKKYPGARIVFAADNDRMTLTPVENPGVTKAKEAADAVKGRVAIPQFEDGDITRTDYDDLVQQFGLDRIRADIEAVLNPIANIVDFNAERNRRRDERDPPPMDSIPDGPDGGEDEGRAKPEEKTREPREHPLDGFGAPHFRCLGVDGTTCYFQPAKVAQVIELSASQMKGAAMLRLAPLQWWEFEFPGKSKDGGVNWNAAINACMQACMKRRKFIPHNAVRGRGAWFEGRTAVFHSGDSLIVDGEPVAIHDHTSRFVYDEGDFIPVSVGDPATTEESRRFLTLCKSLRWQSALSGYLLAGWCVVAPVCGFLNWRPHIWVNGPAGSGKSTVMDKIVKAALGSTAHSVVGNTTEAGIRGALGMDALPIIFDESEPKDMLSQARIRSILDLARVAASESDGLILKGTSNQKTKGYRARSMFVFASINTQVEGYADETRFTQLTLSGPPDDPKEKAAGKAHYEKLVSDMVGLMTPEFSKRLLARTILNLPVLREYVRVFTAAATVHLGAQRLGDQLGPMLAGAYLLNSAKPVTVEQALEWIRGNDWAEHTARDSARDTDRFLQHIMGHIVRHNTPEGGTWERPIGELIEIAAWEEDKVAQHSQFGTDYVDNKKKASAHASLARLGFRVHGAKIDEMFCDVTTSHENFRRILKGTEWAGTKWRKILETIPGAAVGKGNRYFASGVNTPFVSVPVEGLTGYGNSGGRQDPDAEIAESL